MITKVVTLFKVSRFQQKIMRHAEKQESVAHTAEGVEGREQSIETIPKEAKTLDLRL